MENNKKPKNNDNNKKTKSRNSFVLHSYALMYLLLKKGWTIKLSRTKKAKVTIQNYKCIELSRKLMLIDEHLNENEFKELENAIEELIQSKEKDEESDNLIKLQQSDLIPLEDSSETISDEQNQ